MNVKNLNKFAVICIGAGKSQVPVIIKAKSLGLPVYALFGGPVRHRIPLYWSHFALSRLRRGFELYKKKEIKTLDDMVNHAQCVINAGF